MRFRDRFPPWCWSKGYMKFGVLMTINGIVQSWLSMYLAIVFGAWWIPVIWLGLTYITWMLRPFLIDKLRPCNDCPLRRRRHEMLVNKED